MRGIPSLITDIRKQVFAAVARMAYSGDYTQMEDIPFRIVPGTNPLHRESVFLERAIAGERVRLAMAFPCSPCRPGRFSLRAWTRRRSPSSTMKRRL